MDAANKKLVELNLEYAEACFNLANLYIHAAVFEKNAMQGEIDRVVRLWIKDT